jgi:NAD(P)-dependent dehydrogenase (short-subunit alcohol dehydrogenase family)
MTDSPDTVVKIALVTGASRGLGRSTALALARKGVDVVVTYHSKAAEAEAVVGEIEALGRKAAALRLDSGDIAALDGFVAAFRAVLAKTWDRERFDFFWSTTPASASRRRSPKPARRSST